MTLSLFLSFMEYAYDASGELRRANIEAGRRAYDFGRMVSNIRRLYVRLLIAWRAFTKCLESTKALMNRTHKYS